MTNQEAREYTFKALTDLWTGDADRKPERTITTGLLGSIRWWFEVLVRGLGGKACDPTKDGNRCPNQRKKPTEPGHHCVVCELFGCTGWARRFRFEVLDENGQVKVEQITKNQTFNLRFTPLRPISPQEWALLDLTLRLIADYGAIGGKTVYKPSDEPSRANKPHHRDYGLIAIQQNPHDLLASNQRDLQKYVASSQWRRPGHNDFAWASLEHFWYVKGRYLTRTAAYRSSFNQFVGRDQRKTCVDCGSVHDPPQKCPKTKKQPRRHSDRDPFDAIGKWLAGSRGVSKKVFSFKEPGNARRTFGFVKPETVDFNEIKRRLKQVWPNLNDTDFRQGREILNSLFSSAGATP